MIRVFIEKEIAGLILKRAPKHEQGSGNFSANLIQLAPRNDKPSAKLRLAPNHYIFEKGLLREQQLQILGSR